MRVPRLAVPLVLAIASITLPLSAQTESATSSFRRHQSLLHVVGFAAGGMILGAWGGYMTSQIARSDWTDTTGRAAQRLRFSLGGAALGLIAGIFLGTRGHRIVLTPPVPPRLPLPGNGPITAHDISISSARSLSELLRELRPEWVRQRGAGTVLSLPNGDVLAAPGGVQVYLNGALIGGLEALDKVPLHTVKEIRFMNGDAAALRYGGAAVNGVILVTTTSGP